MDNKLHVNGYTMSEINQASNTTRRHMRGRRVQDTTTHYIDLPFLGEAAELKIRRAFQREDINIHI